MTGTSPLTPSERATLVVACNAFHPALVAGEGDDPVLFATAASDLNVAGAAEQAIALLAPERQAEMRQLLHLLESPVLGAFMGGGMRGLGAMDAAGRERLLLALASSRVPQLRSGFQALKRLSSFLFYSMAGADGTNPLWPRIGYRPSTRPPSGAASLSLKSIAEPTTLDADVCIIGSGAGGGVAAAELAAKGLTIVVLEAGPGDQAPDFAQRELEGMQRLYLDSAQTSSRDLGVAILGGACLGGGTTINWQTSLRTPDFIRDEWTESSGCDLFTSSRFTRAMDAVWARSACSTNESFVNGNNAPLQRGCEALGYEWAPIARNSRGCDTTQCGYCTFGCRTGGKQSTAATYLHDAQAAGRTTIVTSCSARRVTTAHGTVTGVEATARTADGREHRVRVNAPRVVVAAGGIESPALLLRSGVTLPHVGCNLYLHPTTAVAGIYHDVVEPWTGPPQTIVSNHFAQLDGNFGFRLEAAPVHPGLLAFAVPWTGAAAHRRLMQRCAHASALIALTRDATGGRVRIRRDGTTTIDYAPERAERALVARGSAEAVRIHAAAGAEEVITLHSQGMSMRTESAGRAQIDAFCARVQAAPVGRNRSGLFSAHQMGTCRMGGDAQSAVCDDRGQVFGVSGLYVADASAFPASSGVNPMITVMALAKCIAEGID